MHGVGIRHLTDVFRHVFRQRPSRPSFSSCYQRVVSEQAQPDALDDALQGQGQKTGTVEIIQYSSMSFVQHDTFESNCRSNGGRAHFSASDR